MRKRKIAWGGVGGIGCVRSRLGPRPPHTISSFIILIVSCLGMSCQRSPAPERLQLSGTLELTEHSLGARVAGRVAALLVDDGEEVKRDQPLATLDRYEQAQRDDRRVRQLFQEGGTTQQAVEQAALVLEDQRIVSPVDGIVLLKIREPGEVVAAGAPVVVVGDRKQLWVRVYVPEGSMNRLRLGQSATVRFDGLPRVFQGHVSFIAPQAEFTPRNVQTQEERMTQTFAIKVTLDERDPRLRPGVAADVTLDLAPP